MPADRKPREMTHSQQQAIDELSTFDIFVGQSCLPVVPGTIEKRHSPEPDIRCIVDGEGKVGFELSELCHPEILSDIAQIQKTGKQAGAGSLANPVVYVCEKKRTKRYCADYPIDLVLFSYGIALSPSVIVPTIHKSFFNEPAPYQRIWYMEVLEELCLCVLPWDVLLSGWRYEGTGHRRSN